MIWSIVLVFVALTLVIAGFFGFVGFISKDWPQGYWYNKYRQKDDSPTISFDMFLNLSRIAPEKWGANQDSVEYLRDNKDWWQTIYLDTYKDLKKYRKWYKHRTNKLARDCKNKIQKKFYEAWQQDIADYREKTHQETLKDMECLYKDCQKMGSDKQILETIEQTIKIYKEMKGKCGDAC